MAAYNMSDLKAEDAAWLDDVFYSAAGIPKPTAMAPIVVESSYDQWSDTVKSSSSYDQWYDSIMTAEEKAFVKPVLSPLRRGCITGSNIGAVTERCKYSKWPDAIMRVWQLDDFEGRESFHFLTNTQKEELRIRLKNCLKGHMKEESVAQWYIGERRRREGVNIILSIPVFRQHPKLLFLATTNDRAATIMDAKVAVPRVGGTQCKFRAGHRINKPVSLKYGDDNYLDQCFLEMMTNNWSYNDLSVMSDVDGAYFRYEWTPDWWKAVRPGITKFYNENMAWWWEDDRSEKRTAVLRVFLKTATVWGRPLAQSKIDALFNIPPPEKHVIEHMRSLRVVAAAA